ncbi:hypothetical protein Srufu_018270 [Streptomyces libani subsp. rufus]|nr:hypothetical protein Srufu_018270 [Streptomyces libani subsp. rufus]
MTVFALGPDEQEWCAELRALTAERLSPLAEKGEEGRVNRPLIAALGELGLLRRLFPADGALRALDLCLLRESLAQECTEAETALALQGLGPTRWCSPGPPASGPAGCRRWSPAGRSRPSR